MFNRVDKCFFISTIIILINLVIIFLLTVGIPIIHLNDMFKISNYIVNVIVLFILPTSISIYYYDYRKYGKPITILHRK